MSPDLDFDRLVERYYGSLYRFALSLAHTESEASDLTQQTFYIWAKKGHQLQNAAKVKSWLFTTLHREFLLKRRRSERFQQHELDDVEAELPAAPPEAFNRIDSQAALDALRELGPLFRAPVSLFYIEDYSYQEIAEVLELPLGTVKSRISRGVAQLQRAVLARSPSGFALKR